MKLDANGWELALTEHQKQFWTGQKLYPHLPLFDLRVALGLGPVDPVRLAAAFRSVVDTEPLLRAAIREVEGVPRLLSGERPTLEVVDLRSGGQEAVEAWLAQSAFQRIEPARSLFEAALLLPQGSGALLFLRLHHTIADGWSVTLLAQRLAAAYESLVAGGAEAEPPCGGGAAPATPAMRAARAAHAFRRIPAAAASGLLGSAFGMHVEEEWRYLRSHRFRQDRAYWARLLRDPIRATEIYGSSLAASPAEGEGLKAPAACHRIARELGRERTSLLRARAESSADRSINVGISNLLLTAMIVLLVRITGERHQRVGLPVHGRRSESDRTTFGLFMQLVAVAVELDPEETLAGALSRVTAAAAEASRHSRFTIANPRRRAFDLLFNFHNLVYPTFDGAPIEEQWLHSANDEMALALHIRTTDPDNLLLQVDVSAALADPEWRGDQFASHYLCVVDELLTNPEELVRDLDLVSPRERPALRTVGRGEVHRLPGKRIEELFEEQAERSPQASALLDRGREWTFGEVDRLADRLAGRILSVAGESPLLVGGLFERSAQAVVAFLATLKAGGVWVPLDPTLPPARIAAIAVEAGLKTVVTSTARHGPVLARTDRRKGLRVIDADELLAKDGPAGESAGGAPERVARPTPRRAGSLGVDGPAYLLFTSGSTGRPKGVFGSHRAAINRICWMWRRYPFDPDEVGAHRSSLAFIDSVWEIFGPLLAGRPVVVVPEEVVAEPSTFAALLARHAVRRLILVPSLLLNLLGAEPASGIREELRGIRRWFLTGEPLSGELARRFATALPEAELYNLYGTTEFFDGACLRVGAQERSGDRVPIGGPLDNTCLYLLDQRLRPLPLGVTGELCVSGAAVPAGYLNRGEESAAKFVANPFVGEDGHPTLYRTGDAARFFPNGRIELLGRLDNQVKIRGYRVELGEIELLLSRHEGVEHAAVVVEAGADSPSLVAYVQPRRGWRADTTELLRHLRRSLPSWMVPRIHLMERLPLTASGKIDRLRLARSGADGAEGGQRKHTSPLRRRSRQVMRASGPGPRGSIEAALLEIWRNLLGREDIGPLDDFFDVGGHSLLALAAVAEIERSFGRRLPLSALFEFPTVAALAAGPLRSLTHDGRQLVALKAPLAADGDEGRPEASSRPLFSVPAAGSTVASFTALARHLPAGQLLYSFEPRGIEGRERPHLTIEEMARSYVREMRTVQPRGPYAIAGRCFGGYVAFEMARQLHACGETITLLAIMDSKEAPLERSRQRSHRGLRKLLAYYPERFVYHLRRRRLLYTLRMKLTNESRFLAFRFARLFDSPRGGGSSLRRRKRNLEILRYLHTRAYHRYVAEPFDGRVTLFWAGESEADETGEISRWQRLARGGLECERLPCRHSEVLKEPYIRELAEKLGRRLQAEAGADGAKISAVLGASTPGIERG